LFVFVPYGDRIREFHAAFEREMLKFATLYTAVSQVASLEALECHTGTDLFSAYFHHSYASGKFKHAMPRRFLP
jgi:hypothetical protein